MTKVTSRKLLSIAVALVLLVSAFAFTGMLTTANAANVSIGSNLFSNTKNVTIKTLEEGLSLNPNERTNEAFTEDKDVTTSNRTTSYASYSAVQALDAFGENKDKTDIVKFEILQENFKNFEVVFISQNPTKSTIENMNIEDIETVLRFPAKKGKYVVAYQNNKFTVKLGNNIVSEKEMVIDKNQATIKFGFNDVTTVSSIPKDNPNEITDIDVVSVLLTDIRDQSFTRKEGESSTNDTSMPVIRMDTTKFLNAPNAGKIVDYIVLNKQYTLSIVMLDTIKSSQSTNMTVKYSETELLTSEAWDGVTKSEEYTNTVIEAKKIGYYAVTALTMKDGSSGNKVSYDQLPLVFKVVNESSIVSKDALVVDTNHYKEQYLASNSMMAGGTKHSVTFIQPKLDKNPKLSAEKYILNDGFDFFSIVGNDGDAILFEQNESNFTYELLYRLKSTESFSTQTGLRFTARQKGPYEFKMKITDKNNRFVTMTDVFATIEFYDVETPILNVTGFPETVYINQSFNVPAGTLTDEFDSSPSKEIKVYFLHNFKLDKKGLPIKDKDGKFTKNEDIIMYKTDANGDFVYLKDADGEFILDANKQKQKIKVYEQKVATTAEDLAIELTLADSKSVKAYKKDDLMYEIKDGKWVIKDGARVPIYTDKLAKFEVKLTSGSFTPIEYGRYMVVYSGQDAAEHKVSEQTFYFDVVVAPKVVTPSKVQFSTVSIVCLCIAGLSLVGLIVVIFIKPKDAPKKTEKK